MPPRSEQDEEPFRVLSYPAGHALHERLGLVFCSWKKPAMHSEHVWPDTALNFPLSLLKVIGMESTREKGENGKKS